MNVCTYHVNTIHTMYYVHNVQTPNNLRSFMLCLTVTLHGECDGSVFPARWLTIPHWAG